MDRRMVLALALTAVVIIVTPLVFPQPERPVPDSTLVADSVARDTTGATVPATPGAGVTAIGAAPTPSARPQDTAAATAATPADTTTIQQERARFAFTSRGAAMLPPQLTDYRSLTPGRKGGAVALGATGAPLLELGLVAGADTTWLESLPFRTTPGGTSLRYDAGGTMPVSVTYAVTGEYLTRLDVSAPAAPPDARLVVRLPRHLLSHEADTTEDLGHLSYGYKRGREDVQSIPFRKLDAAVTRTDSGPLRWVSIRNKYFLVAAMADSAEPIASLRMRALPSAGKIAANAEGVIALPLGADRAAGFTLYTGPQVWQRLRAFGNDLENVNPYGGWIHGMVQPFATIVQRILVWIRQTTQLHWGWVLVVFGVMIRLLLWPLQQTAMRSSLKMQVLQPELMALQQKYKDKPELQRDAIMELYRKHGMSPFSPLVGCLPMLLPMPVLIALFFVFQNLIDFRGLPFLWLPDLALMDPYFITPIFMGVTMFVTSWIGMRNVPPTPQSKMLAYVMPVMMTVIFWKFPSGLNLYYAVQNVTGIPQQWLLARERAKAQPAPKPVTGGKPKV